MKSGLIDLNTVENDDEEMLTPSPSNSPSSTTAVLGNLAPLSSVAVSMELWHACAGPLISLPKKGSAVVYFPQGHLEQMPEHPPVVYDLPPHVFCRVIDVKLHADAVNDEVYAQVSLVPDQQIEQRWREGTIEEEAANEGSDVVDKPLMQHMFCKTLTASDTSTHGGFSVPRRAAEDCFPPLDYKQQRPSQEIVAVDLHGSKWKFRHIYRGQPRRHLLTTGWSAFVNKKKLVPGDAVLFLRSGDGELRLGIRRASNDQNVAISCNQQSDASWIVAQVNAISMQKPFTISFNPRVRAFDILVPYHKFSKSLAHSFSTGMRFNIRSESEESSDRRCSGLIVGVSEVDPVRRPGSKWKCLLVRWDDMEVNCMSRVSPWEVEISASVPGSSSIAIPGIKRSRDGFVTAKPDFQVPRDGNEVSDFVEPLRFQKVLQGQEVFRFAPPSHPKIQPPNQHPHPSSMPIFPCLNGSSRIIRTVGNYNSFKANLLAAEPFQFPRVLKGGGGQQTPAIFPSKRSFLGTTIQMKENNIINGSHRVSLWPVPGQQQKKYASLEGFRSGREDHPQGQGRSINTEGGLDVDHQTQPLHIDKNNLIAVCSKSCRLFGFPLREGIIAPPTPSQPAAYDEQHQPASLNNQGYNPHLI